MDVNKPAGRVTALDAARGIAILMMAYVHMVPSGGGTFAAKVTLTLEGKAAVLFFILAGMTWARMSTDKPAAIYRRAGEKKLKNLVFLTVSMKMKCNTNQTKA